MVSVRNIGGMPRRREGIRFACVTAAPRRPEADGAPTNTAPLG